METTLTEEKKEELQDELDCHLSDARSALLEAEKIAQKLGNDRDASKARQAYNTTF